MEFDQIRIAQLDRRFRNLFINSLTGFKSANLIGSMNGDGVDNLALFSSLVHLGADPSLIGMISRPHSVTRDTRDTIENIETQGYYTINHVNKDIYRKAHQTSARYDSEISEFEAVGLTPERRRGMPAPYVMESRIQIGMKFAQKVHLDINNTDLLIGEIIYVNIKDDIIHEDGHVDIEAASSIAVSSLNSYHQTTVLDSLAYAKPDRKPASISCDKKFVPGENDGSC
jgi:flavin reductase (DIM6/NTAB) family NADH-FMN oxidoreductase RutF